uniref:Uncharacterized protein n=1 Tax=uncultured Desulfobacterium sp. TaxID=201089 RepID=E1YIH7_9BACT|nr:unknown protein [uncultured Desulfobacterium sp.]
MRLGLDNIFQAQDEVDIRKDKLIEKIEARMNKELKKMRYS